MKRSIVQNSKTSALKLEQKREEWEKITPVQTSLFDAKRKIKKNKPTHQHQRGTPINSLFAASQHFIDHSSKQTE